MNTPEENIKTILADWLDALRRHDFATVERRLDPEIFWQGVREDFVCEDRDEAMEMLREQRLAARSSRSSHWEITAAGSFG
jgi:hypothetical protein